MHTAPLPVFLWTAVEILVGGSERTLAEHLTHTQRMAWHCPDDVWHVVWKVEPLAWTGPPEYHPED